MRRYHSLLSRGKNDTRWAIEFGDYSMQCVRDEMRDMKESVDRGTKFKIITTGDQQSDINAAVEKLNDNS